MVTMSRLYNSFIAKRAHQIYNEYWELKRRYIEDKEAEQCIGYPIFTQNHYQEMEAKMVKLWNAYNMLAKFL